MASIGGDMAYEMASADDDDQSGPALNKSKSYMHEDLEEEVG